MIAEKRVGYIAIMGRPNVGKSTLINHIIGEKLAITSRKPQTTRHRIMGIAQREHAQLIFLDTPGVHHGQKRAMSRYLNRTASTTLQGVDCVLFLTEARRWIAEDTLALQCVTNANLPIIWVINKTDHLSNKAQLLPYIEQHYHRAPFHAVYPISAKNREGLSALESGILPLLPITDDWYYSRDQKTDKKDDFMIKELIREKLIRQLGCELPYAVTVDLEQFEEKKSLIKIAAVIRVMRDNHKAMVIGKGGHRLKSIGAVARVEIERYLKRKVFLSLWVKVRAGWADDERALDMLGYSDNGH